MTISRMLSVHELPPLLAMDELREFLPKVPRSTLYTLVRTGRLEGVKVGRRIMVKQASLCRLLKENEGHHDAPVNPRAQELARV